VTPGVGRGRVTTHDPLMIELADRMVAPADGAVVADTA
jgi:hypothetical protein